jgi:hypothetical protein
MLENFKSLSERIFSYNFVTLQNLPPNYSFFGLRTGIRFSIEIKITERKNKRVKNMDHYNIDSNSHKVNERPGNKQVTKGTGNE